MCKHPHAARPLQRTLALTALICLRTNEMPSLSIMYDSDVTFEVYFS